MCKCCECKNNFADVGIKMDTYKHRVYLCGGNSKPPEEERFDFCPKCGAPLGEVKPLTMEQLRQMDGKPVFLETGEVSIREQLIAKWEILVSHDDTVFFFTERLKGFSEKNYGTTWLAYNREFIKQ